MKRFFSKKCISIEQYAVRISNGSGDLMLPTEVEHLLSTENKVSQEYLNICPPYNLLFEIFGESELLFWENEQEDSLLNRMNEALFYVLDTLTIRNEKVIKLLYGLENNIICTYSEVAHEFNVTGSYIQQICKDALRILKHPSRKNHLICELLLDKDHPFIFQNKERTDLYENYLHDLYESAMQKFLIYDGAFPCVKDTLFSTLSSFYPRSLVTEYLYSEEKMIRWYQDMHSIEGQPIDKYIQTQSYILRGLSQADITTIGELYDSYRIKSLWNILLNSYNIGKNKAQRFIEELSSFFQEKKILVNGTALYDRNILKSAIDVLETQSISRKTSICSILIPPSKLEILLNLNYRTIEDAVLDWKSGALKQKCESKYSKFLLGDIYDSISRFMQILLDSPPTIQRIGLINFEELPEEQARLLNTKQKASRSSRKTNSQNLETLLCDFDDDDFDIDDIDFDDIFFEDTNLFSAETKLEDLDIPWWMQDFLQQAGFVYISDLLNEDVNYDNFLFQHNLGSIFIEKLYRAMAAINIRFNDCSETDYPNVDTYLYKKRKEHQEMIFGEEVISFAIQRKCSKSAHCLYKTNNPLHCNKCKYPELKASIEAAGFTIERECEQFFYLRHDCGCEMKYELNNGEQPVCNKCKYPKLVELIESADFSIEESYSTGFYIRHICGYRRQYRFDNTEKPICQKCSQNTHKRRLEQLQQEPLPLTSLQNIDSRMEEKLTVVGIDNTKKFMSNTSRQIFRRFFEKHINIEPNDILILEAAKEDILLSELEQSKKEELLNFAESFKKRKGENAAKQHQHEESIVGLPNIGLDRGHKLESIGIVSSSDLIESPITTEAIWEKLFSIYPTVDLLDIYAIEGARLKCKVKDLPKERKRELRIFVEHIKGPWGSHAGSQIK